MTDTRDEIDEDSDRDYYLVFRPYYEFKFQEEDYALILNGFILFAKKCGDNMGDTIFPYIRGIENLKKFFQLQLRAGASTYIEIDKNLDEESKKKIISNAKKQLEQILNEFKQLL